MGDGSGDLSVQEREANVSAQLEELEALEAIYGEGYQADRGSAASPQVCYLIREIVNRGCRCCTKYDVRGTSRNTIGFAGWCTSCLVGVVVPYEGAGDESLCSLQLKQPAWGSF